MGPPEVADTKLLERILVLVHGAREEQLTLSLITQAGFSGVACHSVAELCTLLREGAGAALVAEELLRGDRLRVLKEELRRQEPWSDFPFVVFSAGRYQELATRTASTLGNVTFLDRPVTVRAMLASVRAALVGRRRQYEARRAIESRDAFLAMLGHELRNPLGALSLAVAVLGKKLPEGANQREYTVIGRQTRHLTRLVDDLLDVARITHGKIALKPERLNLGDAVRVAFETLAARAREQRLDYQLKILERSLWVEGDRQRLEQVFSNLLTNAIKYTPQGGAISVVVRAEEEDALVTVRDTGVGLAPEMRERVFDPFAQVDGSLARSQGGLGLGLALVRSIVTMHGGSVAAASPGLGFGSTFTVRLNRLDASAVEAPPPSASFPKLEPQRILIVEDHPDIREVLGELLEQGRHVVSVAATGPEGVEKLLALAPDMAFVDLGLPGFDGYELARRVRAAGSKTYLIALTGYGQAEDKTRSFAAGFDDHLVKPAHDGDIKDALARGARARAEAARGNARIAASTDPLSAES